MFVRKMPTQQQLHNYSRVRDVKEKLRVPEGTLEGAEIDWGSRDPPRPQGMLTLRVKGRVGSNQRESGWVFGWRASPGGVGP